MNVKIERSGAGDSKSTVLPASGVAKNENCKRSIREIRHSLGVRDRRIIELVLYSETGASVNIDDIHRRLGLFRSEGVLRIAIAKLISNGLLSRVSKNSVTVADVDWATEVLIRSDDEFEDFSDADLDEAIGTVRSRYEENFDLDQEFA